MKVVLQRVERASVTIDGEVSGSIGRGHLLLVGFGEEDVGDESGETLAWMARKIVGLRVFGDEDGRMDRSLEDVDGGLLVVSQFTLYGDASKGRRPSFVGAADSDAADRLYERFLEELERRAPGRVESGEFGAMMSVELVNDGPVTLVLER